MLRGSISLRRFRYSRTYVHAWLLGSWVLPNHYPHPDDDPTGCMQVRAATPVLSRCLYFEANFIRSSDVDSKFLR
ncbi:hypothetical protein VNO77_03997 [Canavalia gladiata]|uniref:Uncharacterized protein n=1 Tax=Canavalia gladiata TaxID=3824 RepID=A0AAN9MVQ4_CANGL